MSARIGVCTKDAVWLLADAATVRSTDGIVHSIRPKQAFVVPNGPHGTQGVVVWTGWTPPAVQFVAEARKVGATFDAVVDAAPMLWARVRHDLPKPLHWMVYSILLAGWSEKRCQPEMYCLEDHEPPHGGEIIVSASGLSNELDELGRAFCHRFAEKPEEFDPLRDGLTFMQEARGRTRQFDQGPPRHYVGGFVTCTHCTSGGTETSIIHRWADRVGEPINWQTTVNYG